MLFLKLANNSSTTTQESGKKIATIVSACHFYIINLEKTKLNEITKGRRHLG